MYNIDIVHFPKLTSIHIMYFRQNVQSARISVSGNAVYETGDFTMRIRNIYITKVK